METVTMAANDSGSGDSVSDFEELSEEERSPETVRPVTDEAGNSWRYGREAPRQLAATPPPTTQKGNEKEPYGDSPRNNARISEDSDTNPKEKNKVATQTQRQPERRRVARARPSPRMTENGRRSPPLLIEGNRSNEAVELPAVLPLNVGGFRFMTRQSTLCKYADSMLAAMFSGRHKLDKDKQGYFFIDSNGAFFGYILEYLRHETMPPSDVAVNVYKEACYYNITPLIERLQTSPSVAKTIVHDAHRAQFPDYYGLKQKVVRCAMDNAVVNQTGEVTIYAFQKVFTPRAPYFNTQHECVADAAHLSVGPWDSPADEEMLIRCIEYDLLSEGFNIKPHEQRRRCKYYNGQNCQKSIYKITIFFA